VQEGYDSRGSPALPGENKRVGASNELFKEYRDSAADAPYYGRGRLHVLLCSTAGAGAYEFRRLRPRLALALNNDRRDVQHAFSIPALS
jgi:hypothetical protein